MSKFRFFTVPGPILWNFPDVTYLISDKGGRVIGDIGEMEDAINDRLVGRVMMLSPDICVVEVGLDTSLGRSTAGTVGEKLGRIWLMKVNGSWESVAVHRELGPISQYRDGFEDELQNAAYEIISLVGIYALIQKILKLYLEFLQFVLSLNFAFGVLGQACNETARHLYISSFIYYA